MQGIVYISSYNSLPCLTATESTPKSTTAGVPREHNLSRFNVSPPNSVVLYDAGTAYSTSSRRRYYPYYNNNNNNPPISTSTAVKSRRSKTLERYKPPSSKTVTWSVDRKLAGNGGGIKGQLHSEDRKLVKKQVWKYFIIKKTLCYW